MQTEIDLRQKSKEDVAASLFLTFGDPGFMMMPNPVPTLRYVWTTEHMTIGELLDNPFQPDIIRTIVVENRTDRLARDAHAVRYHPLQENYRQHFTGRLALGLDPIGDRLDPKLRVAAA
jgi:hypothetical protein